MSLDKAFEKIISEKEAALLKPAASQIGAAIKEYGYLEVYAFPSLDSLLAAGITLSILVKNNIDFTLLVTATPPQELGEPSLLLGYSAHTAQLIRAQKPSALIGLGEKPQGLLHIAVTASNDSSIAALTAAVLSELTVVGYYSIYGLVAGYWRGLDRGKKASFIGIESSIAEMLKLENKVEEIFSLRLFRWPEIATEEAMARTIDPYLPGLTGSPEACSKLLREDPRLAKLLGKALGDAPEQSIAVLGEKLYDLLKKNSKRPRRPTDIIGISYYSYVFPLRDLREAAYVLAYYAAKGYTKQLAVMPIDEEIVSASAHYMYVKGFEAITNIVEGVVKGEIKARQYSINRIRVRETSIEQSYIPIVSKVLRQLGYLGEQEVLGAASAQGTIVSVEELFYELGPGPFNDMLSEKCIEYIEGSIFARINKEKCR